MQSFFPVMLDLRGRRTLVIGGGEIGEGKIKQLLDADATIHVIAPEVTRRVERWLAQGRVTHEARGYRPGDLTGYFVVIAATDVFEVNHAIWLEARGNRQLVNVVDDPPHCNFIMPSIVRRGDLIVAVSTAGRSPASAKLIRREFEGRFGPEWATLLDWCAETGRPLTEAEADAVLSSAAVDRLRAGETDAARHALDSALGGRPAATPEPARP